MRSLKFLRPVLAGAALILTAAGAQAASYNVSNSFIGWVASVQAIGPTTLGTGKFECANPGVNCSNPSVNGLPGVSYTQNGPGSAALDAGVLSNVLLTNGYLEWLFSTPQNGWGGTFQMAAGNGLAFQANDQTLGWVDVTSVGTGQSLDGFFGFSSTSRFTGVRVSGLAGSQGTAYRMADVSVARAAVPEPGSLALLGLGLAGLGLARRRKA